MKNPTILNFITPIIQCFLAIYLIDEWQFDPISTFGVIIITNQFNLKKNKHGVLNKKRKCNDHQY